VHKAGAGEAGDSVREREMRGSTVTLRLRTGSRYFTNDQPKKPRTVNTGQEQRHREVHED